MDMGKKYFDIDGNECNILQMVHRSPEWAANRVQAGQKGLDELAGAVSVCKASGVGELETSNVILRVDKPIPELTQYVSSKEDYNKHLDFYEEQAEIIYKTMIVSLPGGTVDALLIRLLEHGRSILQVPYKLVDRGSQ